jgi:hypothetical protein
LKLHSTTVLDLVGGVISSHEWDPETCPLEPNRGQRSKESLEAGKVNLQPESVAKEGLREIRSVTVAVADGRTESNERMVKADDSRGETW